MGDKYEVKPGFSTQKMIDARVKYPFQDLKIDEFFVFEAENLARVRSALSNFQRRLFASKGKKFTIRLRDDGKYICGRVL